MAKKLDKSKLKSKNAKWNARAEETFDRIIQIPTERGRWRAWFDMMQEDTIDLIKNGTKEEQLEAVQALNDNREAGFDMCMDGKKD